MKVADFIVEFFEKQEIYDFFGYQGTMIAHFVDSICKSQKSRNHTCYNEQGAAFAGCGYAKVSGKCAVVYATSGPGAINLLSGVADAYYDSAPVIFITGQLNTNEYTEIRELRQQGFQETDVISMAKSITKYTVQIKNKDEVVNIFKKAFLIANSGRKGPVLIDLPMDIQRQDISVEIPIEKLILEIAAVTEESMMVASKILREIEYAQRPTLLIGRGVTDSIESRKDLQELIDKLGIPVITSLPARDALSSDYVLNMGHVGAAYGHRIANIILNKKTDLIVSLGCSLCKRQIGQNTERFAEHARIIRIDIDETELRRKVHAKEKSYCMDAKTIIKAMSATKIQKNSYHDLWTFKCKNWKKLLDEFDKKHPERFPNNLIRSISTEIKSSVSIFSDVGQHQLWMSQSFQVKDGQRMIFSGGHGAMGFAMPAAIGGYYATRNRTACFCGDGAFQMNIQELQWIVGEQIPITIFVLNNNSLGLIQQQQDDFFGGNHFGSTQKGGYSCPDFVKVANAYGISGYYATTVEEVKMCMEKIDEARPALIEIKLSPTSKAYPKTYFGEEMHNQRPYVDSDLMMQILND